MQSLPNLALDILTLFSAHVGLDRLRLGLTGIEESLEVLR